MNIMGIDQSLTDTGITVWDRVFSWSTISTEKTKGTIAPSIDYTRRLMFIADQVGTIIKEKKIELAAIEGMSFGSQGMVTFDLGGLSHLLRAKFVELGVDFVVVPPTTLKKFWFGKGNAKKEEMHQATIDRGYDIPIKKNYGTKKVPDMRMNDNVVDSMALCVFAKELNDGILNTEYIKNIEQSKDVFI